MSIVKDPLTPSPEAPRKSAQVPQSSWFGRWAQLGRSHAVWVLPLLALALCCLRFVHLTADFPNHSPWILDQAKYTDEGWWASGAVRHHLLGRWFVEGDYNPAVATPVWPLLLGLTFHFTGVSIIAARALSVLCSVAALAVLFLIVRRYTERRSTVPANLAILLMAASPFAFVFSRLAILDTFVALQFAVLLLVASYAGSRRRLTLPVLSVLLATIILTKATAAVLLPAMLWLAWNALKPASVRSRLFQLGLMALASAAILRAYVALVFALGFGDDYTDFFASNSLDAFSGAHPLANLLGILKDAMWIDPIIYPLAILSILVAVLWLRSLWHNPLFTASSIAIAGQVAFLFRNEGNYAPRYFLPMLAPLVVVLALFVAELRIRSRKLSLLMLLPLTFALGSNTFQVVALLKHSTADFYNAGQSIQHIVEADPQHSHLIVGVSAGDISLMTGLPSISDLYGTMPLGEKVALYHPGWYLAWIGIGPDERTALAGYHIEEVTSYSVFDDEVRHTLILYKLSPDPK